MLTLFFGGLRPPLTPPAYGTQVCLGGLLSYFLFSISYFLFLWPHHTIVNHVFCAGRRFSLSRQKIELILIHKSVTHRHNNNIKRSRTRGTRCGAEAARVAHNHEVIRSKRIAGTSLYRVHRSVRTLKTKTSLAQRQSAGLIILRSADQNPQEVLVLIEFIAL